MIVLAPGWPLWDVASHAAWLTEPVIRLTEACILGIAVVLALAWLRPRGLRCLLAVGIGLIVLFAATRAITAASFVVRPFVADQFVPLYPHAPNTSFPSFTTACFALAIVPATLAGRGLGLAALAITAEVAFGCVYVGVHYATDVVAGAALGAACGWIGWLLLALPLVGRGLARADEFLCRAHLRRRQTVNHQMS